MDNNKIKASAVLILALAMSLTMVAAYECQDDMAYWNSPCEVITPVFTPTAGCNASILNINNSDMNSSIGLTPLGDGTNNFTFNYTTIATYSVTISCNNYSATINLNMGTEEQEPGFNLWLVMFIIFFILIVFGVYKKSYVLIFISGCLVLLMGIYIFKDGITIYGVTLWWIYPLAWIFTGLGILLTIISSIKFMGENEYGGYDYEYDGGDF